MRTRGVGGICLVIALLATLTAIDVASGQGPIRRRIAQRRLEKQCECEYQQAVCDCYRKYPDDGDPINDISRKNCLNKAHSYCVGCKTGCNSCTQAHPSEIAKCSCDISPRRLTETCQQWSDRVRCECKEQCLKTHGAEYCELHCGEFADCILQGCLHDPDLMDCQCPFPKPPPPPK